MAGIEGIMVGVAIAVGAACLSWGVYYVYTSKKRGWSSPQSSLNDLGSGEWKVPAKEPLLQDSILSEDTTRLINRLTEAEEIPEGVEAVVVALAAAMVSAEIGRLDRIIETMKKRQEMMEAIQDDRVQSFKETQAMLGHLTKRQEAVLNYLVSGIEESLEYPPRNGVSHLDEPLDQRVDRAKQALDLHKRHMVSVRFGQRAARQHPPPPITTGRWEEVTVNEANDRMLDLHNILSLQPEHLKPSFSEELDVPKWRLQQVEDIPTAKFFDVPRLSVFHSPAGTRPHTAKEDEQLVVMVHHPSWESNEWVGVFNPSPAGVPVSLQQGEGRRKSVTVAEPTEEERLKGHSFGVWGTRGKEAISQLLGASKKRKVRETVWLPGGRLLLRIAPAPSLAKLLANASTFGYQVWDEKGCLLKVDTSAKTRGEAPQDEDGNDECDEPGRRDVIQPLLIQVRDVLRVPDARALKDVFRDEGLSAPIVLPIANHRYRVAVDPPLSLSQAQELCRRLDWVLLNGAIAGVAV